MNRTGLAIALAIAVVVGVIFAVWPRLDLDLSALFYDSHRKIFIINAQLWVTSLRRAGRGIVVLVVAPAFLAAIGKMIWPRRPMLIEGRAAWFLVVTLALGPGVVTNLVLKDHWHRPRPIDVTEFGGSVPLHAMVGSAGALRRQLFLRLRRAVGRLLDAVGGGAGAAAIAAARLWRRARLRRRHRVPARRRRRAFLHRRGLCRRVHVPRRVDAAWDDLSLADAGRRGGDRTRARADRRGAARRACRARRMDQPDASAEAPERRSRCAARPNWLRRFCACL